MTTPCDKYLDEIEAIIKKSTPVVSWYVHAFENVIKGPWCRWFRIEGPKDALGSTKGGLCHGSAEDDLIYCATAMNELPKFARMVRAVREALAACLHEDTPMDIKFTINKALAELDELAREGV